MGWFTKKFAEEIEKEVRLQIDSDSEARENAKFLREMLKAERAEKLYWRGLALSFCPDLNKKKGVKKNVQ